MKEFLKRMPPEEEGPVMEIRDRSDEKYDEKREEIGSSTDPYEMWVPLSTVGRGPRSAFGISHDAGNSLCVICCAGLRGGSSTRSHLHRGLKRSSCSASS